MNSMLSSLPGVNPNDPRIKNALQQQPSPSKPADAKKEGSKSPEKGSKSPEKKK